VWAKTPAMSVSTEVQRTLVKSPPELWSELSNPNALARHLAELGEIRITSVEPESKIEWETEGASGVVHLKQSGWGTKVTLSVTRVPPIGDKAPESPAEAKPEPEQTAAVEPAPEPVVPEPEPIAAVELAPQPVVLAPEPIAAVEPEPVAESEPEPIAEVEVESTPEPEQVSALEPRLGFFARLFRRRAPKHSVAAVEPEPDFEALATPDLIYEPTPQPAIDLAAELAAVETQMEQETTELLTGVLDRLGAAHHRPFSRG
jgi:outer membrane biosynthesis protein TonB